MTDNDVLEYILGRPGPFTDEEARFAKETLLWKRWEFQVAVDKLWGDIKQAIREELAAIFRKRPKGE